MADQTRKGGAGTVLALALVLAPVLYVLSFGPADYAMKYSGGRRIKTLMTAYAPVVWLHDHTALRGPLERYEAFWAPR
jgi:hypothetical protein